ncbi:MAG: riboflavin biosynthesis protein RibF [Opitutales bacterium]|nr:riboflavin biosynthesis protein RibF [Opitutales bacterium]
MEPSGTSENFCGSTEKCALAVGIFDALHLGHALVLREAIKFARERSAKAFALTFYPHPAKVLQKKGEFCGLIYPPEIREKLLLGFGLDGVFFKKFDSAFAGESPEAFANFLREKFPNIAGIITGENFRFGAGAKADVNWLRQNARKFGFEARYASGAISDGEYISSTRLRKALVSGDMRAFERLAGRAYFCAGQVSSGKRLGAELGFPTLNLLWSPECRPPFGAYASRLENLKTGEVFGGVSNYGVNPTVGASSPILETNLFKTPSFGAGAEIRVELLEFLRPEKKFSGLDELKEAIAADMLRAAEFFARLKK